MASNVIFKMILFTLVFNFGVGIVLTAFPGIFTDKMGGLTYKPNYADSFNSSMQSVITPSGQMENKGDQIYRVLDLTIVGFIERALATLKTYLYGFVQFLDIIFGSMIAKDNPALRNLLFQPPLGIFYTLTTIAYIYGAFYLWTGKDLTESG